MSEKIFCLRPQYVSKFKCNGSKCGALCCQNDWSIYIDAETYKKYPAQITCHLQLDSSGDKYLMVTNEKNCCPMLDEDNLCRIQKTYGENFLSRVCAGYPRIITRFGNFLELALSPTCPLAAELILLAAAPLKFEVIEADEKILRLGANNILQGVPDDFAPLIFDVQLAMISILQKRRLSINQRLIVLGFFLDRIEEFICGGNLDDVTLKKLSAVYLSENSLARQLPFMLASVRFNAAAHEKFMRKVTEELYGEPITLDGKILPAEFAQPIENFLVNEIVLDVLPWRIDASIVRNFGLFLTIYKILECRAISLGIKNVSELLGVASDLSRKINHGDGIEKISALLDEDDMLRLMEKFLRA